MDLYKILGLTPDASKSQIKDAYRSFMQKHHPDKNNGEKSLLHDDICTAYEVLSDDEKRSRYDQYGYEENNLLEKNAKMKVNKMLSNLLQKNKYKEADYPSIARTSIYQDILNMNNTRGEISNFIDHISKLRTTLKGDFFQLIFDKKISQSNNQFEELGEAIKVAERALELLDGVSYESSQVYCDGHTKRLITNHSIVHKYVIYRNK